MQLPEDKAYGLPAQAGVGLSPDARLVQLVTHEMLPAWD